MAKVSGIIGFEYKDPTDEAIHDAVFELMATTDIPRIKVSDILKLAKVSRSTFYRHYDSVDSVVKEFEANLLDSMRAINDSALKLEFTEAELAPTAAMIARMEVLEAHRKEIIALNGPHGDPAFTHKATVFMHHYLSQRISEVIGPSDERELYLAFVVAGHNNMVQYWLEKRHDISASRVAAALNRMYYAPFFLESIGRDKVPPAGPIA